MLEYLKNLLKNPLNSSAEKVLVTAYQHQKHGEFQIPFLMMRFFNKDDETTITAEEEEFIWENAYTLEDMEFLTIRPINTMGDSKFPSGGYIALTAKGRKAAQHYLSLP